MRLVETSAQPGTEAPEAKAVAAVRVGLGAALLAVLVFAPLGRFMWGNPEPAWETGGSLAVIAARELVAQDPRALLADIERPLHGTEREGAFGEILFPRLCLIATGLVIAAAVTSLVCPPAQRRRIRLPVALLALGSAPLPLVYMGTREESAIFRDPFPSTWMGAGAIYVAIPFALAPLAVSVLLVRHTCRHHGWGAFAPVASWSGIALLWATFLLTSQFSGWGAPATVVLLVATVLLESRTLLAGTSASSEPREAGTPAARAATVESGGR